MCRGEKPCHVLELELGRLLLRATSPRAGRVYHIAAASGNLTALADSLLTGSRPPALNELILQLPLHTGDLFGRDRADRPDTFYAWYVESAAPVPPDVQRLQPGLRDSVYTLIYPTMPDHQRIRFVPGLGITGYLYNHHGTVAEADAVLVGLEHELLDVYPRLFGQSK